MPSLMHPKMLFNPFSRANPVGSSGTCTTRTPPAPRAGDPRARRPASHRSTAARLTTRSSYADEESSGPTRLDSRFCTNKPRAFLMTRGGGTAQSRSRR